MEKFENCPTMRSPIQWGPASGTISDCSGGHIAKLTRPWAISRQQKIKIVQGLERGIWRQTTWLPPVVPLAGCVTFGKTVRSMFLKLAADFGCPDYDTLGLLFEKSGEPTAPVDFS